MIQLHYLESPVREQFASLLRLRASPPTVPPGFVRRPRLESRLTEGSAHPVTLVSAGPGYGKTLTLASWSRRDAAAGPVAWLTVDETDNDLQAFWSDLLGALTLGDAVPADSALREVAPTAGFGAREARLVRAGLADLPHHMVLVVDDFHHITNRRVLESFGLLLEHQPPQLRLVLATRADPALRLHRSRVNGDLTDIRALDLAFTAPEAAELFSRNGIGLSGPQLTVLLERTRGWAAGLRLALMCLNPSDIDGGMSRFTGTEPLVAEYLVEEVTDQLPESDRQFLLTTSVTDRLSAELANVLTGRSDGQLTLQRLAAQNAMIVALAGRTDWFSVHPLLRDLLLNRLARDQPGAVVDLHLLAAHWFAAQGEPIPAIRHATAAGQWDEVGRLLTQQALPQVLTPQRGALVAALAPAAARARVLPTTGTLLAAAVCHYHRQDFEWMIRDANAAGELMAGVPQADRYAADVLIAVMRVAHARTRNPAVTPQAAARLLDLLDRAPREQLPTVEHYRLVAVNNIGVGQLWAGELPDAEATLATAQTRCTEMGLGLVELSVQAHLALLDVIHGRLPDADRRARAAQVIADRRGWASDPQALGLYAALAFTQLEQNQLELADVTIDTGLTVSTGGTDIACRLALAIAGVGVAVARRDPAATRSAVARLDAVQAHTRELPAMLAGWCAVAHADAQLITGDPRAAIDLIADGSDPSGFTAALQQVVLAKARLMLDEPEAALDLLGAAAPTSLTYRGPVVEASILAAVAAVRLHRDTAALGAITRAVDLAQGVGMIKPFLTAGPQIAPLITRHRHVVAQHLGFTRDLLTPGDDPGTRAASTPPGERLTERELAVLSYLPTMLKSAEIASDLFVTTNTIKTHQQSIYRKLGVITRRDAVERARALNLL